MIKVDLNINKGFKWYSDNNISVKGYLFDSNDHFFEKKDLVELVQNNKTKNELLKLVKTAKGLFTIFKQFSETEFILVNDIIRPFPIFYSIQNNDIHISDNIDQIIKITKNRKLNPVSKAEFLSAGFVSGNNTLLDDIHITQSGEYLHCKDGKLNRNSYFDYSIAAPLQTNREQLEQELKQVFDSVFQRLENSLNGRMAIIPLSGGFDSRLIACKLKELGHEKILCYTFGSATNNPEKITSEKVAKQLGLDWIFIEYNKNNIGNYINDPQFKEYYTSYSQYSSSFMFQDYFAIKYLKENKLIPDNAIFIPGYSGDFLGGSQLYKNGGIKFNASVKEIASKIIKYRYINSKSPQKRKKEIIEKVIEQLNAGKDDKNLAYSVFENWEVKENLSKFIGRASYIYDFFGYEYRLPYWDKELVDFFKEVPFKYKFGNKLYHQSLKSYFNKYDVCFTEDKNISPTEYHILKFKQFIKSCIPDFLLKELSNAPDYLNYDLILTGIKKDLVNNSGFNENVLNTQNAYIAHWYIKQIEQINEENN